MKTTVVNMKKCSPDWRNDRRFVYVGRPGKGLTGEWGNPHRVGRCSFCKTTHRQAEAVAVFREEIKKKFEDDSDYRMRMKWALEGRYLVCFCAPAPCHADVYVELLEGETK